MVVVAGLPDRWLNPFPGETVSTVALECMHDFGQGAFTKLPDEMQMVRHYDRSIDNKSFRVMQPMNRIKYNYCTIL